MSFKSFEHIRTDLTRDEFEQLALEIFRFQARYNPVYSKYIDYLGINPKNVQNLYQIPFLPISFFKTHRVVTQFYDEPDDRFKIFKSSGTTGMERSKHYVFHIEGYEKSFIRGFNYFYSSPVNFVMLALLPSYIEQGDSSLIYMTQRLINMTRSELSGFYLHNYDELYAKLLFLKDQCERKVLLLGVSYALLDFAEKYYLDFPELIVMETGGMKGRRREMVREELHDFLKHSFGVSAIHSEYGMTELLSQAYSKGGGRFYTPPWMQILVRDMNDPFSYVETGRTGGINIIDLANVYSCAFIETKDLGKLYEDGSFEVVGRFDNSDLRGCNLMVS